MESTIVIAAALAYSCMVSTFRVELREEAAELNFRIQSRRLEKQLDRKPPVYEELNDTSKTPNMPFSRMNEITFLKEKGNTTDTVLVRKTVRIRNPNEAIGLDREVKILRMLQHDAGSGLPVVHLVDFSPRMILRGQQYNSFITPLYVRGNLLDNFKELSEQGRASLLCSVAIRIMTALRRLHGTHSIAHRDIKPQNIYLDGSGKCYLADYDVSLFWA